MTDKKQEIFWTWMPQNNIFVCTTTLSQSCHVNIGWLLYSHPEYSTQVRAREDLIQRMGNTNEEFELLHHSLVPITSTGVKITTKALKIQFNFGSKTGCSQIQWADQISLNYLLANVLYLI